jgi:hypothetical protein
MILEQDYFERRIWHRLGLYLVGLASFQLATP